MSLQTDRPIELAATLRCHRNHCLGAITCRNDSAGFLEQFLEAVREAIVKDKVAHEATPDHLEVRALQVTDFAVLVLDSRGDAFLPKLLSDLFLFAAANGIIHEEWTGSTLQGFASLSLFEDGYSLDSNADPAMF